MTKENARQLSELIYGLAEAIAKTAISQSYGNTDNALHNLEISSRRKERLSDFLESLKIT